MDVEMMSPATSGRWNSVRRSISPEPTSRRFFCAGASWIRRAGFASAFGLHLRVVAYADAGVAALQAVQTDDVQPLILRIGRQRQRGRRPLARDLDDVALAHAEGCIALRLSRAVPVPTSCGLAPATCSRVLFCVCVPSLPDPPPLLSWTSPAPQNRAPSCTFLTAPEACKKRAPA
jgi:hypothetical protein